MLGNEKQMSLANYVALMAAVLLAGIACSAISSRGDPAVIEQSETTPLSAQGLAALMPLQPPTPTFDKAAEDILLLPAHGGRTAQSCLIHHRHRRGAHCGKAGIVAVK